MKVSRWFNDWEFWCRCQRPECDAPRFVTTILLDALDLLRDDLNRPVTVTSGLRCAWWNAREGGDPASGHLDGTEADVRVRTSQDRYAALASALRHGVPRIGIHEGFVHVGVSERLPQAVVWLYPPPRGFLSWSRPRLGC
jgi:hypothetical protein